MSRYTQTIKSILMENKQAGEDIHSITDICTIAKRCLFDEAPMNVISADYRDRLITGFSLHFFNEEIGLEVLPLFKMGISDKIYNNAEYINAIFAHLDKQILSDYATKVVNTEGHDTITDEGTISNTGTSENAKTGADTLKRTGSETNVHSGSVEHADSGYNEVVKTGTETHTYNNVQDVTENDGSDTVINDEHYTDTVINDEHYSDTVHDEGRDDHNEGTYGLDTPQDQITNLRSAAGGGAYDYDVDGNAGINASSRSSMKYMSSASISDSTNKNEKDQTTWHSDGGPNGEVSQITTKHDDGGALGAPSQVETQYGRETTNTRSGSETDSYTNRSDRTNLNSKRTDTFNNETNTRTLNNLQDKTEYDSTDTRTDDLLQTKDLETNKDSTGETNEVNTNTNLEMIYRSMPLLNKVWELFDDLFMMIY